MAKCPLCGQKSSGNYCQWCKYPILRGRPIRRRKTRRRAEEEARPVAKGEARRKVEEAQKGGETKKRAEEKAWPAAKEEASRKEEEARQKAEEARKAMEAKKRAEQEAWLAAKEEAKKKAETAGGVGQATDMIIIDKDGIKMVEQQTIAELEEIYNERETIRERRGFDKRIIELKVATRKIDVT